MIPAGGPERLWLAALREEVATLEATGHRVTVVHASPPELVAMGPDPLSAATGHLAVAAGRDRGRARASDQALARGVGRGGGPRWLAQLGADVGDVPVHGVR
jgi:hypothetical protein